ncbi:THO complex subunit 5 [Entomophthora muscae]|uniref:THO complex subunit 5 n=1 Tax=Entomophthora muscae TaxID=34485 RepID=A0ACC2UMW4_9FUNG|nr:THO complex subunit 5 [Entomophthora muscae]
MSQAEITPTGIKKDFGIVELIRSLSSKVTKRSASELDGPELHQDGLEATSKIRELAQDFKRKRIETDTTDQTDLGEKEILAAFSIFTNLKLINRRMQQHNLSVREEVKLLKEKVNARYLTLKAREAELQLLKDQIFTLQKQSELVEDINIIPEEEFDVQATEPYSTYSNDHEKMLNRLKFELFQRKKLQEQLQEVGKNKSKINLHSSNFRKDFSKIKTLVASMNTACTSLDFAVNKLKSSK